MFAQEINGVLNLEKVDSVHLVNLVSSKNISEADSWFKEVSKLLNLEEVSTCVGA